MSTLFEISPKFNENVNRLSLVDWTAVAAFGVTFFLYLLTLAPTIYNLDSAELTTAVATGGIVRATGYPLYLFLGKFWTLIPVGDMGYRLNLFSAFCGASTIFLADQILRRLNVKGWARFGALGLLATAPYYWTLSLIAEVYTLHTALMAAVILLLLWWAERPSPWRLALPVFVLTLSLGNHAATVLLVPGAVWYVLTNEPGLWRRPANVVWGVGALLLGAAIFLVIPLRYAANPVFNYAGTYAASGIFQPVNLLTWEGVWWLISGKSFSGQMFGYFSWEIGGEFKNYGIQLWLAFIGIGIGPGIIGAWALGRRDWRLQGLLLLMFAANAIFYINYRVVDKATMYLPTYLIWAIWLGVGYQYILNWLKDMKGNSQLALRLVLVAAVLIALGRNWQLADKSNDWSTRNQSEAILAQVKPEAIIFGWWDTVPGIQYLQLVEGQRPDVTVINRFLIAAEDMNTLILSEKNRPIYINNPSIELLQNTKVSQVGPLYLVETR